MLVKSIPGRVLVRGAAQALLFRADPIADDWETGQRISRRSLDGNIFRYKPIEAVWMSYSGNTEQKKCRLTNEYPFFLFLICLWY
jgi:hypothetical protein